MDAVQDKQQPILNISDFYGYFSIILDILISHVFLLELANLDKWSTILE